MSITFFRKNFLAAGVAGFLFSLFAQNDLGATANVAIGLGGLKFVPAVTNISVGDSVVWTWDGTPHTTTSGNGSPSGLWDSGSLSSGSHYTNVFESTGSFPYYCQFHFSSHMTGAVIVATASLPPAIAITNPISDAVFSAPANVTIQATVMNGSAAVTNVEFFVGTTVLTNETTAPFSAMTNNLAAAHYTLTAIASDNNGLTATNSVSISVVAPGTVSLTNAAKISGANFQFSYSANIGLNYIVQRSTNLADWISLVTNTAASNPVVFVDATATNSPGFYRVGRLPNP